MTSEVAINNQWFTIHGERVFAFLHAVLRAVVMEVLGNATTKDAASSYDAAQHYVSSRSHKCKQKKFQQSAESQMIRYRTVFLTVLYRTRYFSRLLNAFSTPRSTFIN